MDLTQDNKFTFQQLSNFQENAIWMLNLQVKLNCLQ